MSIRGTLKINGKKNEDFLGGSHVLFLHPPPPCSCVVKGSLKPPVHKLSKVEFAFASSQRITVIIGALYWK